MEICRMKVEAQKVAFPILHSIVGYTVYRAGDNKDRNWEKAFLIAFLATVADIDWIPGILVGHPSLFHRTITHSFAAAIVCSLAAALIWKKYGFTKMFLLAFAAYVSHLIVDLFSVGPMPLFWPFQSAHLAQKIQTFQHLPLQCDGLKDFACDRLLVSWSLRRFFREIVCLVSMLLFFMLRAIFRALPFLSRRPSALAADEAAI